MASVYPFTLVCTVFWVPHVSPLRRVLWARILQGHYGYSIAAPQAKQEVQRSRSRALPDFFLLPTVRAADQRSLANVARRIDPREVRPSTRSLCGRMSSCPEHVHLLLKPRVEEYNLAAFEQSAKLSFARKMIVHLTRARSTLLEKYRVKNGYEIWQEGGGHDLNIWSKKKAIKKAEYSHENPVKRRLVKSA